MLVNGEGQVIRDAKANGRIMAFEDQPGLTYVAGDATAAYMGKLRRFHRHILFLRPGLFLLVDDLEAPADAVFQWMLHAFEEMELDKSSGRIVSTREDATLDVYLRSPAGITLSQTDQFDTPYNAGIPEDYHRDMPNHWHVTAETQRKTDAARIGAVMAVSGDQERFDLELLDQEGWFGARAKGAFGTVEGWVQLQHGTSGPEGYGDDVIGGKAIICGMAADGKRFVAC